MGTNHWSTGEMERVQLIKETTTVCRCSPQNWVITWREAVEVTFQSALSRTTFTHPSGISVFWKDSIMYRAFRLHGKPGSRITWNLWAALTLQKSRDAVNRVFLSWSYPTLLLLISLLGQSVHSPKRLPIHILVFFFPKERKKIPIQ